MMKYFMHLLLLFLCLKGSSSLTPNITIIGAGISGIAAASYLKSNNISFLVLEARSRIGGRLWTDKTLGAPVDLGASWIHHSGPTNPITKEADQYKITRKETDEDDTERWGVSGGAPYTEAEATKLHEKFLTFMKSVKTARDDLDKDKTLASVMNEINATEFSNPENNFHMAWDMETDYGSSVEDLSAMNFDNDSEFPGDKEELFPGGYDQIVRSMSQSYESKIILNKVVTEINYSNKYNIIIKCNDGSSYNTNGLILTVPLGVLKANSIKFTPSLPEKHLQSISKVGMGVPINKVFLKFKTDFWTKVSGKTFFSCTNGGAPETRGKFPQFVNGKKLFDLPVLLAFAIGNYAKAMESKPEADVIKDAMTSLRRIFPDAEEPVAYVMSKWTSDPYARGGYPYYAVGSAPEDIKVFNIPVNETFYFAGDHAHANYKSSVHGAYLSGQDAAKNLTVTIQNWAKANSSLRSFCLLGGLLFILLFLVLIV